MNNIQLHHLVSSLDSYISLDLMEMTYTPYASCNQPNGS